MLTNGRKEISELFNGELYLQVPLYQRGYSWEEKQINDFIDDFNTLYTKSTYFYGTLLLEKIENKNNNNTFYIVDGQQRLTTLVIYVSCLINKMKELDFEEKEYNELYKKYIKNDDRYILDLHDEVSEFFQTYILGDEPLIDITNPFAKKLVIAKEILNNNLKGCTKEKIEAIISKIKSTAVIVYLTTSQIESAMIFETTNDRGKLLTNLEKTKSYLMYKSSILTKNSETIIKNIHSRFKDIYDDFEKIKEYINDENSALQYSFIAFSKWGYTNGIKEYQHYMENMKKTVEEFVFNNDKDGLNNYIEKYTIQIKNSFNTLKNMLSNQCNELKDLIFLDDIANFYPLLIKTHKYDSTIDKKQFSKICRLCEIYSFRVYSILEYTTNKDQTKWYSLARDFEGDYDKLVVDMINMINSVENDQKFIDKLSRSDFYEAYSSSERNYFFWKYENYLRTTEQPISSLMSHDDLNEKKNKKLKLTIEHIVAQNNDIQKSKIIKDELKIKVGRKEKFDNNYLHSIGNLAIDPQSANSSAGKKDVEEKMSQYFIKAPYKSQNELEKFLDNKKWTIKSIEKRQEKLLNFAKSTWCNLDRLK